MPSVQPSSTSASSDDPRTSAREPAADQPSDALEEGPDRLKRGLGTGLLLVFVIGNLIGAGIFAIVGEVAGQSGGLVWAAFLVALVPAGLTAASYAALATRYPRAGGTALYVDLAFSQPLLTVVVTVGVAASAVTSAATASRAFAGDYLVEFFSPPVVVAAVVFLVVLSLVNALGSGESLKANVVMTVVIVLGLALVIVQGVATVASGDGDLGRALEMPSGDVALPFALAGGALLSFFAFLGFEDTAQMAEECQDPHRTYPRALTFGLGLATVIYILVAVSSVAVVEPDRLAEVDGPLLEVVRSGSLALPTTLFALVACIALGNTAMLNLIAASRLVYGMASEGVLPSALSRIWRARSSPLVAVVVVGLLAVLLAATGDLDDLASTTVLLLLVVFAMVNVSLLRLRNDPVDHEHVSVPVAVPVLGALTCVGLVVYRAIDGGPGVLVRFVLLLGLGVVVYAVQRVVAGRTPQLDAESPAD